MASFREFIPKSYLCFRKGYSLATFKKDLLAGITVGIIALPLAMAFGIASGVSPERGLFTAIIGGFLISAFGGSRVQIGGPAGAFVVLVYDIIQRTGYEGLATSTLIASFLLILFALLRLGTWIKYVPHPLITGFTTGLALVIFSAQIKDFFGLKMGGLPPSFIDKWIAYFKAFPTVDPLTLTVSGATLVFILCLRRFTPKIPWGIAAIFFATLVCALFDLQVDTIRTKFGEIPHSLPSPVLPSFSFPLNRLSEVLLDAFAIALLGGIESLLSCVISDGMIGSRHKSNCELLGQGIANFGSILFGGIPATGAIARTAANVNNGAQTPVAGMVHSLTIFGIICFFASAVSQIPLAALAAVLIVVAWNMSELGHFIRLMRAPTEDVAILVSAFFLTVVMGIVYAITVGMVLASLLFMKRMAALSRTVPLDLKLHEKEGASPERSDGEVLFKKPIPQGVEVFEIHGPFFFGASDILKDLMDLSPKVFILRMRHVPLVDASGMHALKMFYHGCQRQKIPLILSGVLPETAKDLELFGLTTLIGEHHIFPHIEGALERAEELIGSKGL